MAVETKAKKTLLQKYDMPVNNLSYEYIKSCSNGKELERIVKILRSGEEGYFPDLLKTAEDRLASVSPDSKLLCVAKPVLTKDNGYEFYMQTIDEIKEFRKEMKLREEELKTKRRKTILTGDPPPRDTMKLMVSSREGKGDEIKKLGEPKKQSEPKKLKRVTPRNYSEWDKYDPDQELVKMEIEEEKNKEKMERRLKQKQDEELKNKCENIGMNIMDGAGDYTRGEKTFLASQHKDKGNEYYKVGEFQQAIEHYSSSIRIDPTPVAYNNRAMAYLKCHMCLEALADCNKVLEMEPDNAKALLRRGFAHKNSGNYHKALDDFMKVITLQPGNRYASSLAQEMQEKCDSLKKTIRMKITEEDSSTKRGNRLINKSCRSSLDRNVEYNEFGLPKLMCNCSGVPEWVQNPPLESYPNNSSDDEYISEPNYKTMNKIESDDFSASSVINSLIAESGIEAEIAEMEEEPVLNIIEDHEIEKGSGDMNTKEKMVSPIEEINVNDICSSCSMDTVEELNDMTCLPENSNQAEGIEDLSLEDSTTSKITSASEFLNAWQGVKCKSDPLNFVPVLARIDPADLPKLMSNKLEYKVLSTILQCLEKGFLNKPSLVLGFLQQIASLQRFGIIKLFLEQSDIEVAQRLFKHLEDVECPLPHGLKQAFSEKIP